MTSDAIVDNCGQKRKKKIVCNDVMKFPRGTIHSLNKDLIVEYSLRYSRTVHLLGYPYKQYDTPSRLSHKKMAPPLAVIIVGILVWLFMVKCDGQLTVKTMILAYPSCDPSNFIFNI